MNLEKSENKETLEIRAAQVDQGAAQMKQAQTTEKVAGKPIGEEGPDRVRKKRVFSRGLKKRKGKEDGPEEAGGASGEAAASESDTEAVEEVIAINRITKVTKGGKKLSFSALVVVGNGKGRVGYNLSKAAEVSIAIRKAIAAAKKDMIQIPLDGTTIPHEIIGRCGGASVLLKPASDGTGVIAAGPVRAVCDGVGIRNILSKCHRSNNPINVVKATMDGLTRLKPVNQPEKSTDAIA